MATSPSVHGHDQRGLDTAPSSSTREGRFGRMFRTLAPLDPAGDGTEADGERRLAELADAMAGEKEEPFEREQEIVDTRSDKAGDSEENAAIPAGYTYLGQFIDHDITFDPVSSLRRTNDVNALKDFRTPALDLDSVYGRGPDDEPFRYNDGFFILGGALSGSPDPGARDLPRASNGRAIIGDPRNDENVIVAQLQSIFLRFHNAVREDHDSFETTQSVVRWHYQWVVIHDFLKRVCGEAVVNDILPSRAYVASVVDPPAAAVTISRVTPTFQFYKAYERAFMPVEFSGAAYRFGHSMVRPFYRLNASAGPFTTFLTDARTSLRGFKPLADDDVRRRWAIDWRLFFDCESGFQPTPTNPLRVQPSYKIDTQIVDPLANLPAPQFGGGIASLALRNLLRGWRLELPSGESIARAMGIEPLKPADIRIGPNAVPIETLAGGHFAGNTPLWLYVLAEAQRNMATAEHGIVRKNLGSATLGPVGARIVAETIIGLIAEDRMSYLRLEPNWRPEYGRGPAGAKVFEMRDLIAKAMAAKDAA